MDMDKILGRLKHSNFVAVQTDEGHIGFKVSVRHSDTNLPREIFCRIVKGEKENTLGVILFAEYQLLNVKLGTPPPRGIINKYVYNSTLERATTPLERRRMWKTILDKVTASQYAQEWEREQEALQTLRGDI